LLQGEILYCSWLFPQKMINFLLDVLACSESVCLFAQKCFCISFLPLWLTEKMLLDNVHLTYLHLFCHYNSKWIFTFKNVWKHVLSLGGAINLKVKLLPIMHTSNYFTMQISLFIHYFAQQITIQKQVHAHLTHYHSALLSTWN
jgi:hypothetical protein